MLDNVRTFFAEKTGLDAESIQPETELTELGVDSMTLLMIITDLEEEFRISISDRELEKLHTIGDVLALL